MSYRNLPRIKPAYAELLPPWWYWPFVKPRERKRLEQRYPDFEQLKVAYATVMDIGSFEAAGYLIKSLHSQSQSTRDKLVRALTERDKYLQLASTFKRFKKLDPIRDELDLIFIHLEKPGTECYRLSNEVVEEVSNLWEVTAQLLRVYFQLNAPSRINLWGLLRNHLYNDPRFGDLIRHTEFSMHGNTAMYRPGSVLNMLKTYRNFSVHRMKIPPEAVIQEEIILDPAKRRITFHDHVDGDQTIPINTPDEVAKLAQDGYKHYVQGYGIVQDGMVTHLRSSLR